MTLCPPAADLQIPKATQEVFKRDDHGRGVWALQRALNDAGERKLVVDGIFGEQTQLAVSEFQRASMAKTDGIAGPVTQALLARKLIQLVNPRHALPEGMARSIIDGESGGLVAAVDWSVRGGVNCGYTQRRVPGPPFDGVTVSTAFDSLWQITVLTRNLRERYDRFRAAPSVAKRRDADEYAWRLSVLNHNWPYAASRLASGQPLADTTAHWVAPDTRFDDGAAVRTFMDWARYYSLGAPEHEHHGRMVKYVKHWSR